ncbi:MAG: lipopolysaccharide export system permease protein [Saprospiraceae bacterium]
MKIKVLDRLVAKGFAGPALLAFFVVEFVLIMQFMWRVIDDILGKGYEIADYLELLSYFFLVLIPMSLPLTVLLASVMVYGDMAEKYELGSIKSSGVSLLRMLMPGLAIAILIALFSVFSSNTLKPQSYKGYIKKYRAMKTNKLTFVFDEKVFNTDFKNYTIRIEEKEEDGRTIKGALIYDQSDIDKSVVNVIRANSGEMYTSEDAKYLIMDLRDGYHYEELRQGLPSNARKSFKQQGRPLRRTSFTFMRKVFDLEALMDLSLTNSSYKAYETLNSQELITVIDSLDAQILNDVDENLFPYLMFESGGQDEFEMPSDIPTAMMTKKMRRDREINSIPVHTREKANFISDKYNLKPDKLDEEISTLTEAIEIKNAKEYYKGRKQYTESRLSKNSSNIYENRRILRDREIHKYALYKIYSWALVCIIFLFVGAPAGALVRKGGFGYPMLIAIGFYLAFVMSTIIGEKLTRNSSLQGWQGAWLPCIILIPFAVFLTWRALNDKQLFFSFWDVRALWAKVFQKKEAS